MYALITTLHVLACIVLVLAVLLQTGKGADIGAVFGGSSTTIFGSSGAGNFLTKLTTGAAILFMGTSLILTYGSLQRTSESVVPEAPVAAAPVEGDLPAGEPVEPAAGGKEGQASAQKASQASTAQPPAPLPPGPAPDAGDVPEGAPAKP